jgi:signal transduction histidine kinase
VIVPPPSLPPFTDLDPNALSTTFARYTLAVLRDVAARRLEAAQLRELAAHLALANSELNVKVSALAKLDAEKNALVGMAVHDLRTPLAVVLGYAELLATFPQDESLHAHEDVLEVMVSTARQMSRILDDLLDWSAIESGTLRLSRHPVDPLTIAGDSVALAGLAAGRRGITLTLDGEPGLPRVQLDPDRFGQVLANLLGNALKYSEDGQHVHVHVTRRGDAVDFAVIDHGQGIPEAYAAHMFQPFETGGNRPARGERATGLGLAIVKRIVEAHGGSVSVETAPGLGTTFHVLVPAALRRDTPRSAAMSRDTPATDTARVEAAPATTRPSPDR